MPATPDPVDEAAQDPGGLVGGPELVDDQADELDGQADELLSDFGDDWAEVTEPAPRPSDGEPHPQDTGRTGP